MFRTTINFMDNDTRYIEVPHMARHDPMTGTFLVIYEDSSTEQFPMCNIRSTVTVVVPDP